MSPRLMERPVKKKVEKSIKTSEKFRKWSFCCLKTFSMNSEIKDFRFLLIQRSLQCCRSVFMIKMPKRLNPSHLSESLCSKWKETLQELNWYTAPEYLFKLTLYSLYLFIYLFILSHRLKISIYKIFNVWLCDGAPNMENVLFFPNFAFKKY